MSKTITEMVARLHLENTRTLLEKREGSAQQHNTALLRRLEAAKHRFWDLYDPSDPTTAPTSKQVSAWLEEQGVAKRVAEVMAQILRADNLPSGPRVYKGWLRADGLPTGRR